MIIYKLPLELLLLIADCLEQEDLLSWIQSDDLTYAVLSEKVFDRIVALDEEFGWPVSLVRTAAADQMVMFRALLKRTKDSELNKDQILVRDVPIPNKDKSRLVPWRKYISSTAVLHMLCYLGNEHVVRMVLDTKRVELSPRDSALWTPIHVAAYNGHNPIIRLLLRYGVDVNESVWEGPPWPKSEKALHIAIEGGHFSTVKYLVEEGANVLLGAEIDEQDSLWFAAQSKNPAIMKYVLAQGCFDTTSMTRALFEAVNSDEGDCVGEQTVDEGSDSVAVIQLLVDAGAKYAMPPGPQPTVLDFVRSAAAVKVLFRKFPNLAAEYRSTTPFALDSFYSRFADAEPSNWDPSPLASTLMDYGLRFGNADSREYALLLTAEYGRAHMFEAMLEEQPSLIHWINDDDEANSALHLAAMCRVGSERLRCVKVLVEHGSDIHDLNEYGQTPLHKACIGIGMAKDSTAETQAVVAYLVEAGADIFAICSKDMKTPFHCAAENGETEAAMVLLEAAEQVAAEPGGEPFGRDGSGYTGLQTAVRMGHAELVERLVERGANINVHTERGDTLLHLAIESAVRKGYDEVPGYLIMMGCILLGLDVSAKVAGGRRKLEKLSNTSYMRIVRYFCHLDGYDRFRRNHDRMSPFGFFLDKCADMPSTKGVFDGITLVDGGKVR